MRRASLHLMLALAAAVFAGCGDTSGDTGTARFAVSVPQSLSSTIARVAVASGGPDIRTVWVDLAPTNGVWGGTIGNIPAGTGRAFAARAYDASGTLLFSGSADGVTILSNQTTLVAITLQQVNPPPPFDNEAPLIDFVAVNPSTVAAGGTVSLYASAHDPNPEDMISYAWSATAGTISAPTERFTSWTAPTSAGLQTVTLTVTDSRGLASSALLFVNVVPEGEGEAELSISFNSAPQVSSITATATRLAVGQPTTVFALAMDPDGDSLSYAWSASCAGTWTDATSALGQFTPSIAPAEACNNCRLSVSVSDGRGGHNTGTVALCVSNTPPSNQLAPVILRSYRSSDTANPGDVITYEVAASDPQGSTLGFSWQATTGTLATPTGDSTHSRVTWTAPPCASGGTPPSITVTVTNAFGLTATRSFTVTGLPGCSVPGTWALTGPRVNFLLRLYTTATLLPNGKVLVAGGSEAQRGQCTSSTELYDPASNTWSATGFMLECRYGHTATLLPNGKVLVAGGLDRFFVLRTAELYDPATGTWSPTGSMVEARAGHTATLLPNGQVLVQSETTAELYDPASGTWSMTGSLAVVRYENPATLLQDGRVLVAGGRNLDGDVTTAELYDPGTGTWSSTGSPVAPVNGSLALLPDGKVFAVSGTAAQLYDPATGTWTLTGSPPAPLGGPETVLRNGKVLVAYVDAAALYDPATGTWTPTAPTIVPRYGLNTATLLPDGRVLVTSGSYESEAAELYTPL
ncbi:kelch-like protein [Corallococcus sp. AB049A]|uniref:Kelch repeat-containing protein n=1 Tax=Corallococcus sp. AB049A TaxID=2316721 RepID=UPI000EE47345|nr:kelch motif-containing protein [Corallococcus sp. AB049A]RKI74842.1 kelch-like protein [Corallococcus sp. AB049A]